MTSRVRVSLLSAVLLVAALSASCGGAQGVATSEVTTSSAPAVATPGDMEHVHGIAADPGTGDLMIATHHGLYRADAEGTVTPVGDDRHDLMGFSISDDGHFVASGHPAPGSDLPPNLGLVASHDRGTTWQTVSLSGEADFHLLKMSGATIYGADASGGRFLKSVDGGMSWKPAALPNAGLRDLAVSPNDARDLVVATDEGLYRSQDGAATWKKVSPTSGLVTWPTIGELIVVGADGGVSVSRDDGVTFSGVPGVDGQPVAITTSDDGYVYIALADGRIVRGALGSGWTPIVS